MNQTFSDFRVNFSNNRTYEGYFEEILEPKKKKEKRHFFVKITSLVERIHFSGCPKILSKIGKIAFLVGCTAGIAGIILAILNAQISLIPGLILGAGLSTLTLLSAITK